MGMEGYTELPTVAGGGRNVFFNGEAAQQEVAIAGGTYRFVARGGVKGESDASV